MMIASINLCKDKYHYKDIGFKFYLHRGGLKRGVWNQAKNTDGSIDIKKSDSTEILLENGELPKVYPLSNDINMLKEYKIPYVFHHWGDNPNKRIEQNKFWKPVWENRAKREVNDIILDKSQIAKIEVFEHNLPLE